MHLVHVDGRIHNVTAKLVDFTAEANVLYCSTFTFKNGTKIIALDKFSKFWWHRLTCFKSPIKTLSKQNTVDLIFHNGLESIKDKICRLGLRSRTEFTFRLVLLTTGKVLFKCQINNFKKVMLLLNKISEKNFTKILCNDFLKLKEWACVSVWATDREVLYWRGFNLTLVLGIKTNITRKSENLKVWKSLSSLIKWYSILCATKFYKSFFKND